MLPERICNELDKYDITEIEEYISQRILNHELYIIPEEADDCESNHSAYSTYSTYSTYTGEDSEDDKHTNDTQHDDELHEMYTEALAHVVESSIERHASVFKNYQYMTMLKEKTMNDIETEHDDIVDVYETRENLDENIDILLHTLVGGKYPLRSRETYMPSLTAQEKKEIGKRLEWIYAQPQPPQRTDEWYLFRHQLITASSAWKLLDTSSQQNSYVYDKCQPLDVSRFQRTSVNTTLHWGHKYEPLAVLYYEDTYKTKVEDFGCIRHAIDHHIGASPDGINVDPSSGLYGRMLEIKNIVNREINGIPKKEYWIQMQLQMEVCQLDECDFLECRFKEYESYEEYVADGKLWHKTEKDEAKGAFLMFSHPDHSAPHYEYPPNWSMSQEAWEKWEEEQMERMTGDGWSWTHTIYWRLEQVSCVLVERNPWWYQAVRDEFKKWGETIVHERENGCEHRISKKRRENRENREKQKQASKEERPSQAFILTISTDDL